MSADGRSVAPPQEHRSVDIETSRGTARAYIVNERGERRGSLVLGHGAGKGTNTPDLIGLLALADEGWRVVLVDQPWVLAGRRLATRPATLDEAWAAVLEHLRSAGELAGPLVVGGRSAGARVACRTALDVGAAAVVALAFPLIPPGKTHVVEKWRTSEARGVVEAGIPLVVVQGKSDAFGGPAVIEEAVSGATVCPVAGGHGFSAHPDDVVSAVRGALRDLS